MPYAREVQAPSIHFFRLIMFPSLPTEDTCHVVIIQAYQFSHAADNIDRVPSAPYEREFELLLYVISRYVNQVGSRQESKKAHVSIPERGYVPCIVTTG